MNQDKNISLRMSQLRRRYLNNFPRLIAIACESSDIDHFVEALRVYAQSKLKENIQENGLQISVNIAAERILLTAEYEGKTIHEFSTSSDMQIHTFEYLWIFLRGKSKGIECADLLIDLYHLFKQLEQPRQVHPQKRTLKHQMERWSNGLDHDVIELRERNKQYIIELLISRIEHRHSPTTRYLFDKDETPDEKRELVIKWWNESRFHLAMAIKSPTELNNFLNHSLSKETMALLFKAKRKGMPFFVTPYYLSLLNTTDNGYDDSAIRSYILYSHNLVETYGSIKAWEKEDIVVENEPNAAGWLLPDGHNIHRRYPDVAILIPDSMGRACGGLCTSCQRMYDFQSKRLNFDFEELKPKDTWDKRLRKLMHYFEYDAQLRDILITGGDALMSQNKTLKNILEAVYRMAIRKQKANKARYDGEKFAEIQRVRLGSRLPAYLPMRINDELIEILRDFKERASAIGIKQFIIQTHFQTPLEVTPEAERAIQAILSCGWIITNQLVYTVAVSRRGHTAQLRQTLNKLGVICYYTFSVKGFNENYEVFTPISRSMQEQYEEKIFGKMAATQQLKLAKIIDNEDGLKQGLTEFMAHNRLPFLATDRSVLNLPAIGKSMTFKTIGVTPEGKRILKFEHDVGRRHSQIIESIGEVYIVENKSIAAYLHQLASMGEHIEEYHSIWDYSQGITEPRFSLFEYPEYEFGLTSQITNFSS